MLYQCAMASVQRAHSWHKCNPAAFACVLKQRFLQGFHGFGNGYLHQSVRFVIVRALACAYTCFTAETLAVAWCKRMPAKMQATSGKMRLAA
jgi:predicted oxidoreductase